MKSFALLACCISTFVCCGEASAKDSLLRQLAGRWATDEIACKNSENRALVIQTDGTSFNLGDAECHADQFSEFQRNEDAPGGSFRIVTTCRVGQNVVKVNFEFEVNQASLVLTENHRGTKMFQRCENGVLQDSAQQDRWGTDVEWPMIHIDHTYDNGIQIGVSGPFRDEDECRIRIKGALSKDRILASEH